MARTTAIGDEQTIHHFARFNRVATVKTDNFAAFGIKNLCLTIYDCGLPGITPVYLHTCQPCDFTNDCKWASR